MAKAHASDAVVLAGCDFRPLSDPECGLAGPYRTRGEALAALAAAGFAVESHGGGHDGAGRYGTVVVVSHPTEGEDVPGGNGVRHQARRVCYAAEVFPAGGGQSAGDEVE